MGSFNLVLLFIKLNKNLNDTSELGNPFLKLTYYLHFTCSYSGEFND